MDLRQAPALLDASVASGSRTIDLGARGTHLVVPLVSELSAYPSNHYLCALYQADREQPTVTDRTPTGDLAILYPELRLTGWMLHLAWAKNPAPMNRSGARGGWRADAKKNQLVREMAYTLAVHRIPRQPRIRVRLDWIVTTRTHRDEDNLVRTMKHLTDGIRLAGVVDDDTRTYVLRDMPEILYDPEGYAHMRFLILRDAV